MSYNLQTFESPIFGEIQTLLLNGKVFFPATRSAQILGYSNPYDAILKHCRKDGIANREVIDSLGRTQKTKFITEGNLYRLIIRSKLPTAQQFEHWVFDVILPTIRKQGFFIDPKRILDPDVIIQLANRVKELQAQLNNQTEQNQILYQQIDELQPKADYCDLILSCPDPISVTEIAQDYGMSAIEFNQLLRKFKIQHYLPLRKVWVLNKQYLGLGYARILPLKIDTHLTKNHMYWTQKGRLFLYHFLKDHGIFPYIESPVEDPVKNPADSLDSSQDKDPQSPFLL